MFTAGSRAVHSCVHRGARPLTSSIAAAAAVKLRPCFRQSTWTQVRFRVSPLRPARLLRDNLRDHTDTCSVCTQANGLQCVRFHGTFTSRCQVLVEHRAACELLRRLPGEVVWMPLPLPAVRGWIALTRYGSPSSLSSPSSSSSLTTHLRKNQPAPEPPPRTGHLARAEHLAPPGRCMQPRTPRAQSAAAGPSGSIANSGRPSRRGTPTVVSPRLGSSRCTSGHRGGSSPQLGDGELESASPSPDNGPVSASDGGRSSTSRNMPAAELEVVGTMAALASSRASASPFNFGHRDWLHIELIDKAPAPGATATVWLKYATERLRGRRGGSGFRVGR